MTCRRCFLPDTRHPGSLHILSIPKAKHCAPFQLSCLKAALDKWHQLFTISILEYTLSAAGVIMLAYVPNKPLTHEAASRRLAAFDNKLRAEATGPTKPRLHAYTPRQLNSISEFMQVFNRDFRARHRRLPPPKNLPEGTDPIPRQAKPYLNRTVQHTALPPVFTERQLCHIRRQLKSLGFRAKARTCDPRKLHVSAHGIGTRPFLEDLEARCDNYLYDSMGITVPACRIPEKKIVPFQPETWKKRLGELVSQDACELHPRVWGMLMSLDMVADSLLTPECFRKTIMDSKNFLDLQCLACLPLSLTLLLGDGLLRWYYRKKEKLEFPRYNWYRKLEAWET